MKTRVLTGLVAGIAAILALLFLPVIGIRIAVMVLCVIGSYEMLSAVGLKKHKLMLIASSLFAAVAPFLDMIGDIRLVLGVVLVYVLLLTGIQLMYNQTLRTENVMFILATSIMIILPISASGVPVLGLSSSGGVKEMKSLVRMVNSRAVSSAADRSANGKGIG